MASPAIFSNDLGRNNRKLTHILKWGIIPDLLCEVDIIYMPKPYNFTGKSFVKNSKGNIQ